MGHCFTLSRGTIYLTDAEWTRRYRAQMTTQFFLYEQKSYDKITIYLENALIRNAFARLRNHEYLIGGPDVGQFPQTSV